MRLFCVALTRLLVSFESYVQLCVLGCFRFLNLSRKMAAAWASLCCCFFCLLPVTAVHRENITAAPGEAAILSCRVPNNDRITDVELTRDDLGKQHVLWWRGWYDEGNQHPSFKDRVELLDQQMKDGDVSSVLKNVTKEDSGTYECRVLTQKGKRRKRSNLGSDPISIIILKVDSSVSQQLLEIKEGVESVLLPCKIPTFERKKRHVEWSRPDLNPSMVHLRREQGDALQNQNPNYRDRTSMVGKALETGNLALTLRKPSVRDMGNYTCSFFYFGHKVKWFEVQLKVHSGGVPTWATVPLVLVGAVIVGAVIGGVYFSYRKIKAPQVVTVDSGKKFVRLPCKIKGRLTKDSRMAWTTKEIYLAHVFENSENSENGSDNSKEQHNDYKDRTRINDVERGDLSLILTEPTSRDGNLYTCTIYGKDSGILKTKTVKLKVRAPQVEVNSGVKSVVLPCQTDVHLTEDVTVEWTDGHKCKVHVHNCDPREQHSYYRRRTEMKGVLESGDFSLTLKYPTHRDRGNYFCTVSSRGKVLKRIEVILKVRVPRVKEKSQVKSVLLPCKTKVCLTDDVTVEWTDEDKNKVHVHRSDRPEEPHSDYRGRTEMKKNRERGDFSLTLWRPTCTDKGSYFCTVSRGEEVLVRNEVILEVREFVEKVKEGVASAVLHFRTTPDLPGDTEVTWYYYDPKEKRKVCLCQNVSEQHQFSRGQMTVDLKTGDIRLHLKNPKVKDSGEYECEVVSNNNISRSTKVMLEVTGTDQYQDEREDMRNGCRPKESDRLLSKTSQNEAESPV
ncbi:uncharacterized protein KZ484_009850 [Pholidichthys leucotaenia]